MKAELDNPVAFECYVRALVKSDCRPSQHILYEAMVIAEPNPRFDVSQSHALPTNSLSRSERRKHRENVRLVALTQQNQARARTGLRSL